MNDEPYLIDWRVPEEVREKIPKRKPSVVPLPVGTPAQAFAISQELFRAFGLDEYLDSITIEPDERPIPHAFKRDRTKKLAQLYEEWAPHMFARLIPELVPPVQAYNKVSMLGYPENFLPDDKQPYLEYHMGVTLSGDLSMYEDGFITQNQRLQTERLSKKREYMYLTTDGVITREVSAVNRRTMVRGIGCVHASRSRGVSNMPMPNLTKQILDTAMHKAMLKYTVFHHNMYGTPYTGEGRPYLALDVKHFERFTSALATTRGQILGGLNGKIVELFEKTPFLVPTIDRKKAAFIIANRAAGWLSQFPSGSSEVTTLQKETFLALYSQVFRETRGLTHSEAIDLTLRAGDQHLTIMNYGDDNFLFGEEAVLKDVFAILSTYMDVEEEVPPKFLGFIFQTEPKRKFALGKESYLLKTYMPERSAGPPFRPYPHLGWMLKRQTYEKYGMPEIAGEIFPLENKLLEAHTGAKWSDVVDAAVKEQLENKFDSIWRDPNVLLDKTYMLTEEEKIATGLFFGFYPVVTGPAIKRLLGPEWVNKLRF